MRKRLLALVLCLALCLSFVPLSADAMTNEQHRARHKIMKQIQNMYQKILITTELETTNGLCGLLVSWELYFLEINNYVVSLDGNQFYDTYAEMEQTDAGFPIHAYPASDYSLEEALYTITKGATEDVYNVMVGFQWTNTDAGKKYGHVCMIHAIIDGYVYFVEGFELFGTPEGQPVVMDITSFSRYWESWTEYEGTIYFGKQAQEDYCKYYSTDHYLQTLAPLSVLDAPKQDATQIRKASTGERLHAVGAYQAKNGTWYYKIEESGAYYYLPASSTEPVRMNYEDVRLTDMRLPSKLKVSEKYQIGGKIKTPTLQMEGVWLKLSDSEGKTILDTTLEKNGKLCNLGREESTAIAGLTEGVYTYEIYADLRNYYIKEGVLQYESKTVPIATRAFTVGNAKLPEAAEETAPVEETKDGWQLENGTWYYYEDGQPRTGWFGCGGVDYYLKEDGSVSTGWVEINGINRYFSETGALRMGWMDNNKERYYLLRNGARATGWRIIDGGRYYLGEDGVTRRKGWLEYDGKLYYLDENGKACVGWVDLPAGRFSFHADGYLLARSVKGETIPYDGNWKPAKLLK